MCSELRSLAVELAPFARSALVVGLSAGSPVRWVQWVEPQLVGEGGPTRSVRRMMADVPCRWVGRRVLWAVTGCGGQAVWRLRLSRVRGYPRRSAAGSRPPPTALRGTNRTPLATAQSGSRARSGTRRRRSARRRTPAATIQPGCRPGVVTGYSTPVEGSTVSRADPRGPGGRSSVPV